MVVSSYAVTARLSGAIRQVLSCPGSLSEVHDNAGAAGSISELGLELSCKDGAVAATLEGSATARRSSVRVKVGSKTVSRSTTLWVGGLSLSEPRRHLKLTFSFASVSVNHALVVNASASSVVVVDHSSRTYHLELRITPQYSTT